MTLRNARRVFRLLLIAGMLGLLAACAPNAPQDALKPEGPIARREHQLFVPVFWIATVIFFIVEALLLYAIVKFRDRPGREEPKQIHGNARMEFAWTAIPALILLGVAIPTVITIFKVEPSSAATDKVTVRVIGHQWWWEYRYEGVEPEVVTANELVIPTGRPVLLKLQSADVIHSFWVPRLAGKKDAVPERTNLLEFSADKPGVYEGQCAEFCAIAHANMRLKVIAKTPADFSRWLADQQRPPAEPSAADATAGKALFAQSACIQCHAIKGVSGGQLGPDLTHYASRSTFASAMFENTEELLFEWIKHARDMKPGVLMPNFDRPLPKNDPSGMQSVFRVLSDQEIRQIVAYLMTLK